MKRILFSACLALSLALPAFAESGPFGLGLVIGEPTGISASYRLGKAAMLQGTAAWDLTAPGGITFASDYLFLFDKALKIEKTAIPLYIGFGAKLAILMGDGRSGGDDAPVVIAARVPLGVRWLFDELPLEAFLELTPGIRLFPETAFDSGGGIGLRWYFARADK